MVRGHVPLQAEAVEQRFLRHRPLAHHRPVSRTCRIIESVGGDYFKPAFFNTIRQLLPETGPAAIHHVNAPPH
jgi:hypothetical protein